MAEVPREDFEQYIADIRAERRAGELLKKGPKARGAAGNPGGRGAPIVRSHDATTQPTYADLDIDKHDAARWQQMAEVPQDDFEQYIADIRAERRAGELLKKMPKAKGGQPYQEKPTGNQVFSVDSLRARH